MSVIRSTMNRTIHKTDVVQGRSCRIREVRGQCLSFLLFGLIFYLVHGAHLRVIFDILIP